jgi:hypothetical protein
MIGGARSSELMARAQGQEKEVQMRLWMPIVVVAALMFSVSGAMAAPPERPVGAPEALELRPEAQAFLDRAGELRKDIEVTRLELSLLEAKDAPEGEIALKAEQMYRLRGELYALRAKNRELAGELWQSERGRPHRGRGAGPGMGQGRGRGMGPGMGQGMGQGRGHGMGPGMGQGMGQGRGHGMGPGMGQGMGQGRGHGMGPGMGRGMGQGRGHGMGPGMGQGMGRGMGQGLRLRERLHAVPDSTEPGVTIEEELED